MIRTVAIAGVGLIGGSFGLALRKAGFAGTILGVSSPATLAAAVARGAVDTGVSLEEAAVRADLILLAQPIRQIIATLHALRPLVAGREVLVTDVGSTKVEISRAGEGVGLFVGGHPMAGKEVRGVGAADADLFAGRPWVLTGESSHSFEVEFRSYLERFGARVVSMDAATHDRFVAWGSHLPQIVSTALAATVAKGEPRAGLVAGPGLMDMTRLAMSSYDLWGDILSTNREEIAGALRAFADEVEGVGADFEGAFAAGAEFAVGLRNSGKS